LAVEALRCGLRFETLRPVTDGMLRAGVWDPAQVEPNPGERPAALAKKSQEA
jgi:hypothetical protein